MPHVAAVTASLKIHCNYCNSATWHDSLSL